MNTLLKAIAVIALLLLAGFFGLNAITAQPKEALANCYSESNKKLETLMQTDPPQNEQGRKLCNDAFNEANTMRQCVNNVYAQYGQTKTALARRLLNRSNTNPVDEAIEKHNDTCGKQFTETTIK